MSKRGGRYGKTYTAGRLQSAFESADTQAVDNRIAGRDENGQSIATAITDDSDYVKNSRLSAAHSPVKAGEMIAAVLPEEMYDVLKGKKAFHEARYKTGLKRLW